MTLRGQLGLQYLNIGEIKGKLDHRAHRVVRPGSGLRCSDSIAPASVTTTSSGYHGRYGRATKPLGGQERKRIGQTVSSLTGYSLLEGIIL
jgi:hypothetical protein